MSVKSRNYLKGQFENGDSPTGEDFSDVMDSFVNILDDSISLDTNRNLQVPNGITLGGSTAGPAGTLRYNSGTGGIEISDGVNWNPIVSGSSSVFASVGGAGEVAYAGGNVGIGTFATPPTFRLEVNLNPNTGVGERVRFGNGVISNGQGASATYAQFSNQAQSDGNDNYAVRQGQAGDVSLNAPLNQPVSITQARTQTRVFIAPNGNVVIGNNATLSADMFQVNGSAGKTAGGATWAIISDERLKKDIEPFEDGLKKLMEVRPVKFHYNGILNTNTEEEEVGIIGQELEKIFPYMVSKQAATADSKSDTPENLRVFNSNALTYVMVNAIKELASRVEALEKQLASAAPARKTAKAKTKA